MSRRDVGRDPRMENNPNKHARGEKMSRKSAKGILLRLGKYVMQHWPLFLVAIALTLLSNQLSLLGPMYSGEAIDAISAKDGVDFDAVWLNVGKMLACYVASAILAYVMAVLMIYLSQKIVYLNTLL